MRLDLHLSKTYKLSRAHFIRLIKEKKVKVNGKYVKPSLNINPDDKIELEREEPKKTDVLAEKIPLDIVYEDQDLLVINKAYGMVVHPACGHYSGTLVNALLAYCKDLSPIGGVIRPGIVHRLDKETNGLILVAKNQKSHIELAKQFKQRTIIKKYQALVRGNLVSDYGIINQALIRNPNNRKKMMVCNNKDLLGREAITKYNVLKRFQSITLLDIELKTGRTHQIRVHLAFIGHPIVGDKIYGNNDNKQELKLQAYFLAFKHPISQKELKFELPSSII